MEKILNSALNYAKQGIKVFPLKNTSNTDITLNSYQNMATTDITKSPNGLLISTIMSVLVPVMV